MQRLFVILMALASLNGYGIYEVGDLVSDMCWPDSDAQSYCLNDAKASIRVLLYNGGWCGPCKQEFSDLVPKVGEFNGKPVTFISVSGGGWSSNSSPTTQFLREWKAKYQIPFPVVGKPGEYGNDFHDNVYIPNVAIIDPENRLTYKAIGVGSGTIFAEVRKLLD